MRVLPWSLVGLLGCTLPALAAGPAAEADWQAVPDSRLAEARAGFDAGNGLLLALGVERVVEVNGQIVASRHLVLDQFSVQNGGITALAQGALAPLLVQNSVNGQLIRSLTTIDVTVNALATLKSLNLEGSLRQALSTVILPR